MESMNRIIRLTISLMVLFSFSGVSAQGGNPPGKVAEKNVAAAESPKESPEDRAKKVREKQTKKAEFAKEYQALPSPDPLLEVKNISFQRKVGSSARGEFLDVQFNLVNKDIKTKEYAVYVLAVHEAEAPVYYPSNWRSSDPQKGVQSIRFQSLAPEALKEDDVLNATTSPEMTKYLQEKQKNAILDGTTLKQSTDPNLDDYVLFLTKNADKALKVKVYGNDSPSHKEALDSNLNVDNAELTRDVNYKSEQQTYTIQSNKFFTTVTTHHFSMYRPDYLFFNKVVILVFDNERPRNKLIFRAVKDIGKIKMKL
jgi:hypothetical protein